MNIEVPFELGQRVWAVTWEFIPAVEGGMTGFLINSICMMAERYTYPEGIYIGFDSHDEDYPLADIFATRLEAEVARDIKQSRNEQEQRDMWKRKAAKKETAKKERDGDLMPKP